MSYNVSTSPPTKYWQAAAEYGIDTSQLEYLLALTHTQRLDRHDQARQLVLTLREADAKLYGYDPRHPPQSRPAG